MSVDIASKKRAALQKRNAKWHVFYVQTRHEKVAAQQLTEDGFEVFLPIKRTLKHWSQRKTWVEEPLFNSYIFIRVSTDKVYDLLQHPKVVAYVKYADRAATIREDHLELIKKMLKEQSEFDIEKKDLDIGTRIQFESGPFRGFWGVIIDKRGKKKAVVKLDELDHQLVVDI